MEKQMFDDHNSRKRSWEEEMLRLHGWYVHFVYDDDEYPNSINFHTHGLESSFGHSDLQICFPLAKDVAHDILADIVGMIKTGAKFKPGNKYADIIGGGLSIEFIQAKECGRQILRVVFPDAEGNYKGELYRCQFDQANEVKH